MFTLFWLNFAKGMFTKNFLEIRGGLFILFWFDFPLKMFDWYLMTVGRSTIDWSCIEKLCMRPFDLSGRFLWYFWWMNHFYGLFRYHYCKAQWRKSELLVLPANQISFICTLFWSFGDFLVRVYNNQGGRAFLFTPLEKTSIEILNLWKICMLIDGWYFGKACQHAHNSINYLSLT